MGKVSKENGVLKLVRAGGIVEQYKHPIKAARIMEIYPRHCVTRPDFFKFPIIVVKPESVLKLGQVFYIVPYHTIYRYHRQYTHDHSRDQSINKQTLENIHRIEEIDTSFFHEIIPVENIRNNKQSINRQVHNRASNYDQDYDSNEAAASGCFPTRRKGGGLGEISTNDTASKSGCLKPCLKKNRSKKTRAQQGPRVRFSLPNDQDDEKWDTDFSEF